MKKIMQYVVLKDEESGEIEVIGRFKRGIGEVWQNGRWESAGMLQSLLIDGLLQEISETEAKILLRAQKQPQLQAA